MGEVDIKRNGGGREGCKRIENVQVLQTVVELKQGTKRSSDEICSR